MLKFALRALPVVLFAACFGAPLFAQPTSTEQCFIYLLNRARHDPAQYAADNSLGTLLDGIVPSQPLAVNNNLVTSSRFHSNEMAQNGYFAHQSEINGDWPNKMVRDAGYPLDSSFPDDSNNLESLAVRYTSGSSISYSPSESLLALIVDSGVSPPGHRYHLLSTGPNKSFYDAFREVGTGYVVGFQPEFPYNAGTAPNGAGAYWSIHTGLRDSDSAWLTGVVFNDTNSNGRYDIGEGLSGVTVTATGPGTLNTTTNAAGGWSIAVSSGNWTVTCSGGSFSGNASADATVGTENVEVDFRSGQSAGEVDFAPAPSGPTINVSPGTLAAFNTPTAGTPTTAKSYTVSGVLLTADITITAPGSFQVSLTSTSGWTSNLTLTQVSGSVGATPIYVRYNPASGTAHNGSISHTSAGATTKNVQVTGTVGTPSGSGSSDDSGGGGCSTGGGGWPALPVIVLIVLAVTLRKRRMTA